MVEPNKRNSLSARDPRAESQVPGHFCMPGGAEVEIFVLDKNQCLFVQDEFFPDEASDPVRKN